MPSSEKCSDRLMLKGKNRKVVKSEARGADTAARAGSGRYAGGTGGSVSSA
jgi:hypothetical protein